MKISYLQTSPNEGEKVKTSLKRGVVKGAQMAQMEASDWSNDVTGTGSHVTGTGSDRKCIGHVISNGKPRTSRKKGIAGSDQEKREHWVTRT